MMLISTKKKRSKGDGGWGIPLKGLNEYVPLKKLWFSGSGVLNKVYNLTV